MRTALEFMLSDMSMDVPLAHAIGRRCDYADSGHDGRRIAWVCETDDEIRKIKTAGMRFGLRPVPRETTHPRTEYPVMLHVVPIPSNLPDELA